MINHHRGYVLVNPFYLYFVIFCHIEYFLYVIIEAITGNSKQTEMRYEGENTQGKIKMGVTRQATKISVAQLKMAASEMADMAAQLSAIACKMEDNGVKSIHVTHRKTFNTGMKYCGNFCSAASAGWQDAALGI